MINIQKRMGRFLMVAGVAAAALSWSGNLPLSDSMSLMSTAEARVGRPLTPASYAGVGRRTTARGVAAVGAVGATTAGAAAVTRGAVATGAAAGTAAAAGATAVGVTGAGAVGAVPGGGCVKVVGPAGRVVTLCR
jgi:hypothetical protein